MNSNSSRFAGMLGFAMRAGKLIIGTESVCRAMAKGMPKLVLIPADASDATKKKITVKSEFYGIPYIVAEICSADLASLIGKSFAPMAIAVTDSGFAEEISKALSETTK